MDIDEILGNKEEKEEVNARQIARTITNAIPDEGNTITLLEGVTLFVTAFIQSVVKEEKQEEFVDLFAEKIKDLMRA